MKGERIDATTILFKFEASDPVDMSNPLVREAVKSALSGAMGLIDPEWEHALIEDFDNEGSEGLECFRTTRKSIETENQADETSVLDPAAKQAIPRHTAA
jgi:hypothetical protein